MPLPALPDPANPVGLFIWGAQKAWPYTGSKGQGQAPREGEEMTRDEAFREIEEMVGFVPAWFKAIPENALGPTWELLKNTEMAPGPLPPKYRQLIGMAVAAQANCPQCVFYHKEIARALGASEDEIRDAAHWAKVSAGWAVFTNAMQPDPGRTREETLDIADKIRRHPM